MAKNAEGVAHSAKYTAATWKWGGFDYARLLQPDDAATVFHAVNAYMALYRLLNPAKHSLRHCLLHRHAMIDHLLRQSGCRQIIEIAAGFSPRGARFSRSADIRYFEVDLPAVVAAKERLLRATAEGCDILSRSNYSLCAGDVCALDLSGSFPAAASAVLTEGLMMYFARAEQMQIWQTIAGFVTEVSGCYLFDYIPLDVEPPRSPVGRLLSRWRRGNDPCAGDYAYDERNRWQVRDDLLASGFSRVEIHDSSERVRQWSLPESNVRTQVLVYECH